MVMASDIKEKIFIGVAWPYANGPLHLGHVAGCYLPPDIFARYHRMKGSDVLMVSGSDEHGTPITVTADKLGVTPQDVVDRFHGEHARSLERLGVSFDLFTRTTTENHSKTVQALYLRLKKNGYIYPKTVEAFYCPACFRFLPDRYIEGTCPHCGAEGARGDQCDGCGKTLDAAELKDPGCKLCGGTPELRETEHMFFRLSEFEKPLLDWLSDKNYWRPNVLNFTRNFIKDGLKDRGITRDLIWGVKVPEEGYGEKRFYVWFDAVTGYLSASKEWAQNAGAPGKWEEWWKNPDARHYYFLAKDNIPFHTIIWPAMLMAHGGLNLAYDVPANEYLTMSGRQFSKSRGIGIVVDDSLDKFGADAIRYYLSSNMPDQKDTDWTWEDFVLKNNSELVGAFGNFIHRVLTFTQKNFGAIPAAGKVEKIDERFISEMARVHAAVGELIEKCDFKKGMREIMALAQTGNKYFDETAPWKLIKEDRNRCAAVMRNCIKLVKALSVLSSPYLPFSAQRMWEAIGEEGGIEKACWCEATANLRCGFELPRPEPLFGKLDLEEIIGKPDEKAAAGGGQADKPQEGIGNKTGANADVKESPKVENEAQCHPFSKADMKVAKILGIDGHPDADKLYVMSIDVGEGEPRSLVAGMQPFYRKEELLGQKIVLVANMKPVKLRGVPSQGMMLAAEDSHGTVAFLAPPEGSEPGDSVYVAGALKTPEQSLKYDEFAAVKMNADANGNVTVAGAGKGDAAMLRTEKGLISTQRKVDAGAKVL
ncbi:MAG: methionine--tRNA ligase [Thermoplasmata archaeon HGW-Thermoplasmata-1]|nr:MAG: methionine--tRNA ligase [Thermoplasmata archaeon HGW-Thermoplasmata-1]